MKVNYSRAVPLPVTPGGPGVGVDISDLTGVTVYVHQPSGGATFSLRIQVNISSVDSGIDVNQDWIDVLATPLTTPAMFALADGGISLAVTGIRVYLTTLGTGTAPQVLIAGRSPTVFGVTERI